MIDDEFFLTVFNVKAAECIQKVIGFYSEHPEERPREFKKVKELFRALLLAEMPDCLQKETEALISQLESGVDGWKWNPWR